MAKKKNINGLKAMDKVAHEIEIFKPYYKYVKTSCYQLQLIGLDDCSVIGQYVKITFDYGNGYVEIEYKKPNGSLTKVSMLNICLTDETPSELDVKTMVKAKTMALSNKCDVV